jgi:hypothetical protein
MRKVGVTALALPLRISHSLRMRLGKRDLVLTVLV